MYWCWGLYWRCIYGFGDGGKLPEIENFIRIIGRNEEKITTYLKTAKANAKAEAMQGRYLITKITDHLKKQQHQIVTVEEFCQYMGLQQDTVARQLR